MSLRREELKARVLAKKQLLESRLRVLEADALGEVANERDRLKERLAALRETTKEGWGKLSDEATKKLNAWLRD